MKFWIYAAINDNSQDIYLTIFSTIYPFGIDGNLGKLANFQNDVICSKKQIKVTTQNCLQNITILFMFWWIITFHIIPLHWYISVLSFTYTIHNSLHILFILLRTYIHTYIQFSFTYYSLFDINGKGVKYCITKICCLLLISSSIWICNLQNQSSVCQSPSSSSHWLYQIYWCLCKVHKIPLQLHSSQYRKTCHRMSWL